MGLLRLQLVRVGVVWTFFSLLFLSSFSLSLGNGPMWTEILSQRAVKPTSRVVRAIHGYCLGLEIIKKIMFNSAKHEIFPAHKC